MIAVGIDWENNRESSIPCEENNEGHGGVFEVRKAENNDRMGIRCYNSKKKPPSYVQVKKKENLTSNPKE